MFASFKNFIGWKEFRFTEEQLIEILKIAEKELRKEINDEYKTKIDELESQLNAKTKYITGLEKQVTEIMIKNDLVLGKLKKLQSEEDKITKDLNKKVNKNLAEEIFGGLENELLHT